MNLDFLDYTGTFFVLVAALLFTSKKAASPKVRRVALICFVTSNGFWIPMAILLGLYGMLTSQIILCIINIKGLIYVRREIKK